MTDLQVTKPGSQDYIKAIFFGQYGTGKTNLLGTAEDVEEANDVLFVSAESGEATIRDRDIDMVNVTDFQQIDKIKEFLYAHTKFRDKDEDKVEKVNEKYGFPIDARYRTICLDSLTEIDKLSMMDVQGIDRSDPSSDVEPPQGEDWQRHISNMRHYLRAIRDVDAHVLFSALQDRKKDEKSGEVSITPDLPGSLAGQICGFLDVVGYTFTKKTEEGIEYGLMTESDGKYATKDRYGDIPTPMQNPSFEKIYSSIYQ